MTHDFASPLEDRLRAALTAVAEQVSIDQLPAMGFDEELQRARSPWMRTLAMAALAAALAVGVGFAVRNASSTTNPHPTPASIAPSTTPPTKPTAAAVALACSSKRATVDHLRTEGRATTMVPGTPTALLACRYHGFNQAQSIGTLAKSASFDPIRLANDLNAQPPLPKGLVENCPNDNGETIDLLFGYADGSRLRVSVHTSGCQFATNGVRTIRMNPIELARLQEVLGKDGFTANNTTPTNDTSPTPPPTSTSTPPTSTSTPVMSLQCPSAPPRILQPQPIAGSETTLVPGTPTMLLACRYHGLNQPEPDGTLAQSAGGSPDPIAAALNSQPAIPPGSRTNCPADFDEKIVLLFGYDDGSTLTVSMSTAGCRYASNGSRTVNADPATLDQLQAVLGKDASP